MLSSLSRSFFLKYRNSLPVATSELPCISLGLRAARGQFCASVKWEVKLWESSDAEVSLFVTHGSLSPGGWAAGRTGWARSWEKLLG